MHLFSILPVNRSDSFELKRRLFNFAQESCQQKKIQKALEIAEKAHQNQYRIGGERYINHVLRVAVMSTLLNNVELTCIGLLHDVLEDSDISFDYIKHELGIKIAKGVYFLTKRSPPEFVWKGLDEAILHYPEVLNIKVLDRIDNIYTVECLKDRRAILNYLRESQVIILDRAKRANQMQFVHELEYLIEIKKEEIEHKAKKVSHAKVKN